jgi:hypothetical protein
MPESAWIDDPASSCRLLEQDGVDTNVMIGTFEQDGVVLIQLMQMVPTDDGGYDTVNLTEAMPPECEDALRSLAETWARYL